jgi:class 3 adenylate cyclase
VVARRSGWRRRASPDRGAAAVAEARTVRVLVGAVARRARRRTQAGVTVLFADVKGSMELASQVDPEDWHKILERFFEILAEATSTPITQP